MQNYEKPVNFVSILSEKWSEMRYLSDYLHKIDCYLTSFRLFPSSAASMAGQIFYPSEYVDIHE